MKLYTFKPKKNTAQAMVEFAIVLPLLLLLLYGLLEAGRLLFIYSTIVTASRQAARYGSATGEGINPGIPRYQDCAGIRVAANRVDFLNAFNEYDVIIQHDHGPGGSAPEYYCTNVAGAPPDPSLPLDPTDDTFKPANNDERLIVTVVGDYHPIVPKIVPFLARTVANGNPIRAVSARTILTGVPIEVTPPPGSGPGPSPTGLTLSVTATPNTFSSAGQVITLKFTLTNTGTDPIPGPFTITYTFGSVTCTPPTPPDLAPGETAICQDGTFQITQAQLDAGVSIQIDAQANSGGTVDSNPTSVTINPGLSPSLALAKSASMALATVGDAMSYTYTITNTGNVTLSPPYTITDDILGTIDCSSSSGSLAPLASISCTIPYTVNSTHVQQNQIVNTATATALFGTQAYTSAPAAATVAIYTGDLFLTISASPASATLGQTITYAYSLKNNSGQNLVAPYTLTTTRAPNNCFSGTLTAGARQTCTADYVVTQADFEAGSISNSATASATRSNGNQTITSNNASVLVTVTGQNPALSLQATASPTAPTPPEKTLTVGLPIIYNYTVTNTGNINLASLTVTDPAVSNISCSGASLAPGATVTCTGTHTVVQADLDAGIISGQAAASALYVAKSQTVSATAPPITIITYNGARLNLQITPNPASFTLEGEYIAYIYTLTNTGNVPLTGISVSDNKVLVDCGTYSTSTLLPGSSLTCSGSYKTTSSDVSTGAIVNTAIAKTSDGTQLVESNSATATVLNLNTACASVTAGPLTLTKSSNTMSMTITNPNSYAITVKDIYVVWNNDQGHQGGQDRTLKLQSASLGGIFWTGNENGPNITITPSTTVTIPANATSTIVFTFHQSYDNWDNTEEVLIHLSTPGCENSPIHQTKK